MKKNAELNGGSDKPEPEIAVCFRLPAKVVRDLRRASEKLGYDQTEFVKPLIVAGLPKRIEELERKRRKELDAGFNSPLAPYISNAAVAA